MKKRIITTLIALLFCAGHIIAQTGNYNYTLPNMQSVYYQTQVTFPNTPDNATSGTISCNWLGCQDVGIGNPTFYCYILLNSGYQTFANHNAYSNCGFVSFSQPISSTMLNEAIAAGGGSVKLKVNVSDGCPAGMGCSCCNDPYIYNLKLVYNYSQAAFTVNNSSICPGETVSFSDTSAVGVTSRKWYFTGGSPAISVAANPQVTYANPGVYDVALVTTSPAGTDSTFRQAYITVKTPPLANVTPGGATTFCSGGNVVLSANTGSGLSYQWRKNGTPILNATSSNYSAAKSGNYSVIVTSSNGCTTVSTAVPVTVNPLPTAVLTANGPTTFCPGSSVVLSATTGSGFTYVWKKANVVINGATASNYTATSTGTYKVVITNSNGCSRTSNSIYVLSDAPVANITPQGPTTVCNGAGVTLQANTGSGLSYQWKLNGTNISGANGSSYTAYTSGTYKVVVTNGCGSKASAGVDVVINPIPNANISAGGPVTFCTGSSVTLNANTGAGLTYQWKKNGTNISGATTASYIASVSGSYTVAVTNALGCSNNSNAIAVTVNTTQASITAGGPTTFCNGDSVILTANGGANLIYQWLKNNTTISGATGINYTAKTAGSYKVIVTNTATTCAKTSAAVQVAINCKVADAFLTDGINVSLSPNPFSSAATITINNLKDEKAVLTIYADDGRQVETHELGKGKSQFVTGAEWSAGIYVVKVTQGSNKKTFRLVKND